jgi:hypothetical protein
MTGFSVGKEKTSLYLNIEEETRPDLLRRLGKVTTGKAVSTLNKLDDVDPDTLKEVIVKTVQFATNTSEYCV